MKFKTILFILIFFPVFSSAIFAQTSTLDRQIASSALDRQIASSALDRQIASSALDRQIASSALDRQIASSAYVLPYPSFMPGSTFYRPHLLWEVVSKYFYFGSLGQFKYNLKESDKYLVEAKTLYEYGQFMYASNSLNKSDQFFLNTINSLGKVQVEIKDSSVQKELLKNAALKHIEVLTKLESSLPPKIVWSPEKVKASSIDIKKEIDKSMSLRKKAL